jgi:catechol 2,3-dioxygenase
MGHVHLHVGSLDGAAAFYRDALGLEPTVWSYPGALFLAAGGYHHHLGVNTWAGEDAPRPGADDARLLEWEIVLPDRVGVERAARSLEGAGHQVTRGEGGVRASDPWGTTLFLRS